MPRVGAPVLVTYATFSAHPKGVARVGGLPGSAAASSSVRSSASSPRAGGATPFSLRVDASSCRNRALRSARVWEGALNAAPRLPSSELALNWLLLPLHLLWPPELANFTRGPGFSLLPSTGGKRPAGRGQWSLGKVVGAKAPDGGPSGRSPAQAWAPSASPASVTLQAGRAAPTRPLCDPEQPVPPPGAGLCLPEPTHPPSPGAPPPALRSANKRRVPQPGPASHIPPPAAGAPQSGSPLAPGVGLGPMGWRDGRGRAP